MIAKTSAHYQREYRKRLREKGYVKKEVWILPSNASRLDGFEKLLRLAEHEQQLIGDQSMDRNWTTSSLYEALQPEPLFASGNASLELIEGLEPTLHIVMYQYGDLPIFLTVSGQQIIAECVLWSVNDVEDVARFNEDVLRTHKYFPLSTISLDRTSNDRDYYHMFGALSSLSSMENIIYEIEVLANNVIQATEAYGEYLTISVADS